MRYWLEVIDEYRMDREWLEDFFKSQFLLPSTSQCHQINYCPRQIIDRSATPGNVSISPCCWFRRFWTSHLIGPDSNTRAGICLDLLLELIWHWIISLNLTVSALKIIPPWWRWWWWWWHICFESGIIPERVRLDREPRSEGRHLLIMSWQ